MKKANKEENQFRDKVIYQANKKLGELERTDLRVEKDRMGISIYQSGGRRFPLMYYGHTFLKTFEWSDASDWFADWDDEEMDSMTEDEIVRESQLPQDIAEMAIMSVPTLTMDNVVTLISEKVCEMDPRELEGLSPRCKSLLREMARGKLGNSPACKDLPRPDTVWNLLYWSETHLLTVPGFGKGSIKNLNAALVKAGCSPLKSRL